jgi:hypothetical protein
MHTKHHLSKNGWSKNKDITRRCTWSWKVGSRTTPGDWKIVLKAEGVGQTETYFTVTE